MHETKLGQLIDQNAGRDAVHVALAPMRAAEKLQPGEHVGFIDPSDKTLAGSCDNPIGIVDPYLRKPVKKDEWFFLCLYPQTTTGLRHVWTHPAFSEAESTKVTQPHEWLNTPVPTCKYCGINTTHANAKGDCPARKAKEISRAYLEAVAASCDVTYNFLMETADSYDETGSSLVQHDSTTWRDGFPDEKEFWKHWEIITGRKAKHIGSIFCCTC